MFIKANTVVDLQQYDSSIKLDSIANLQLAHISTQTTDSCVC